MREGIASLHFWVPAQRGFEYEDVPPGRRTSDSRVGTKWLRRQITPGLLRHHVGGVPGGPVLVLARPVKEVRTPRALLALDMGSLGSPERVFQVFRGRERRFRGVHPAWVPSGD